MSTNNTTRLPNSLIYTNYGRTEDDVDRVILLKDFIWDDPILGIIKVPKGFLFDGASIPGWCWSLINLHPFSSEVVKGGLIHDWLYRTRVLDRKDADEVFRRILRYEGVLSDLKISIIYQAVRVAGESSYNKKYLKTDYFRPDLVKQFLENK